MRKHFSLRGLKLFESLPCHELTIRGTGIQDKGWKVLVCIRLLAGNESVRGIEIKCRSSHASNQ